MSGAHDATTNDMCPAAAGRALAVWPTMVAVWLTTLGATPAFAGPTVTTPWGARADAWAVCQPDDRSTYVWRRDGVVIPGPTSPWYWIATEDAGSDLTCGYDGLESVAVHVDGGGEDGGSTTGDGPAPDGSGDGPPFVVTQWGARAGAWAVCDAAELRGVERFSWLRDQTLISGPTSEWYLLTEEDAGTEVSCRAHTASAVYPSAAVAIDPLPEPPSDPPPPAVEPAPRRLPMLDFAPHLEGDVPYSILPDDVVRQRVDLVAPYTEGIRTFACYNGTEAIRYAHELGLRTMAGAWINKDAQESDAELRCLIDLARQGVVDFAIVGSEVLTWGGLTAAEIVAYVERFRTEVPDVPVTTAVLDERLLESENAGVVDAVDFVWANFYPFWDGIPIEDAVAGLARQYDAVVEVAAGKQVWISETGWPDGGWFANGLAEPTPENAARYLNEATTWAEDRGIFYAWYGSFDEPWKEGQEYAGVASHWGLFTSTGTLKDGYAPWFGS